MAKVDIVFPTQTPLSAEFTSARRGEKRFEVVIDGGKGMVIIKKAEKEKSASITSTYSEGLYWFALATTRGWIFSVWEFFKGALIDSNVGLSSSDTHSHKSSQKGSDCVSEMCTLWKNARVPPIYSGKQIFFLSMVWECVGWKGFCVCGTFCSLYGFSENSRSDAVTALMKPTFSPAGNLCSRFCVSQRAALRHANREIRKLYRRD